MEQNHECGYHRMMEHHKRIGYACKLIGVPNTDMKSCTLKNAGSDRLIGLIRDNLRSLNNILDYNIQNNIRLFRISSDLIPFGSNEVNKVKWWEIFQEELLSAGEKIKSSDMRVSLHPGQYTVLNSNSQAVVQRAVEDLIYHARILDGLGVGTEHKIILHVGGSYGDKFLSMERFVRNYQTLPENVKRRLVIENDDKIYHIGEVLEIGLKNQIPVVFDHLHFLTNQPEKVFPEKYWIDQCRTTWKKEDGIQKIHYSQQAERKRPGSHSDFVRITEFMEFYEMLGEEPVDIMLEVKDKNLSCVKCIHCTTTRLNVRELEKQWSRYKYTVLERSPNTYKEIREFLKNKKDFSAVGFYTLLENGLLKTGDTGSQINAMQHVWGYFKNCASEKEKEHFFLCLENYKLQKIQLKTVKNVLKKLAEKYDRKYLLDSYYFL